jgi:HK97 family phage major capsid protein
MTLNTIQTSVEDLGSAVKEFKEDYTQRLQRLEEGYAAQQVAVASMPALLETKKDVTSESKSFQAFLRGHPIFSTKSLSAGDEPGSFTIPVHLQSRIHEDLQGPGSFRSLARTLKVSSSFVDMIIDMGLPEAKWVEEKGERAETETSELIKTRIMVHELYAKPCATQKLLDDSEIDVETWLIEKVSQKIRRLENFSFLNGTGENQPKGILNYPITPEEGAKWGQFRCVYTGRDGDFHSERPDVLIDVMHRLPARYLEGACWLMSSSALSRIRSLKTASGRPYHEHALETPFRTQIFGYPVILMDEMPALIPGEPSASVVFGNFKEAYQIVDRHDMHILRDPYSNKPYVEFYINKRVGGDVVNFESLIILNLQKKPE